MFDEADYNGKKYFTFLVGELGSEPKPPYLIEITVGHQAPNSVIVHQKLMRALSKVGFATEYENFGYLSQTMLHIIPHVPNR